MNPATRDPATPQFLAPVNMNPSTPRRRNRYPAYAAVHWHLSPAQPLVRVAPQPLLLPLLPCTPFRHSCSTYVVCVPLRYLDAGAAFPALSLPKTELRLGLETRHIPTFVILPMTANGTLKAVLFCRRTSWPGTLFCSCRRPQPQHWSTLA